MLVLRQSWLLCRWQFVRPAAEDKCASRGQVCWQGTGVASRSCQAGAEAEAAVRPAAGALHGLGCCYLATAWTCCMEVIPTRKNAYVLLPLIYSCGLVAETLCNKIKWLQKAAHLLSVGPMKIRQSLQSSTVTIAHASMTYRSHPCSAGQHTSPAVQRQ